MSAIKMDTIMHLPVEKIRPNPYQPRKMFDLKAMDELASSIREYGVMQPITVRYLHGTSYELISGERRLRACRMLGMTTIPAIIGETSDRDSALLALVENLQRENINFLEEAEGYQNILADYQITQEELSVKVGKSQSSIANKLRILRLPSEAKRVICENNLTERHSRALLKIPDEKIQMNILQKVVEQGLNVQKTEELVERAIESIMNEKPQKQKVKRYIKDLRLFTNTIKQAVDMMHQAGVDAKYKIQKTDDTLDIVIKIPYDGEQIGYQL